MQGKVEGEKRGRPKCRRIDKIMEKLGLAQESTLKLAKNRGEWRKAVYGATRSRHNSRDE